jgi:PPK2 family polyphosphate:nucleotide phosphotransferase
MKKLTEISTVSPDNIDKEQAKKKTKKYIEKISDLQKVLYAQGRYSLLVVLQGLDASGKDGLISTVLHGVNPLGCEVVPFKAPTKAELAHDFLWRIHSKTPEKGKICIFNRSHYEDVLVPVVENWIDQSVAEKRYKHINNFESLLKDNNTIILKFYLHISKERQHERLTERKTNPLKFWKHNDDDWDTAKKFDHYQDAYDQVFLHCNQPSWTIIPSDQNWYKEYLVAKKIKETLESLPLEYPGLVTSDNQ